MTLLLALVGLVLGILAALEDALGHAMTQLGLPHPVQTVLAVVLALLVIVAAFRLFGGFIRVVLVVFVVAVIVHAVTRHDYTVPAVHGGGSEIHL